MTIQITRREQRSAYMFMLQNFLKLFSASLIKPRKTYPAGSPRLEPPKKARKKCDVQERRVEDMYIYDLTAKSQGSANPSQDAEKKRKRLYFFAGGGWQMPASSEHWALCAEVASQLPDTIVSIVSYPLAPNSPAPVTIPHLLRLYNHIMHDAQDVNENVIFAGDSAGGNIILCLTLLALVEDENAPCPSALLAICPSTDLRRHNPDIQAIAKYDPLLNIPFINRTALNWRGEWEAGDPRISPLLANIEPFVRRSVKIHGVVGRYDILSPDAILFREKCSLAGVQGEWLEWDKQMHCFPLTWGFKLPEGVAAKDWMVDLLRRS